MQQIVNEYYLLQTVLVNEIVLLSLYGCALKKLFYQFFSVNLLQIISQTRVLLSVENLTNSSHDLANAID